LIGRVLLNHLRFSFYERRVLIIWKIKRATAMRPRIQARYCNPEILSGISGSFNFFEAEDLDIFCFGIYFERGESLLRFLFSQLFLRTIIFINRFMDIII
jgi:hypothetical protein